MCYPLGLNLGPTYVSAAHALEDGSIVAVTRVKASTIYQNFSKQCLETRVQHDLATQPKEVLNDTNNFPPSSRAVEIQNLLAKALEAILTEAKGVLGREVVVKAISIPYHWNDIARQALLDTTKEMRLDIAGSHMLLKFPNALEKAYHLGEKSDYCSIIVDYNPGYLHLLLCETVQHGGYALVENQVQIPHLGESYNHAPQKDSHYEQIEAALTSFLAMTTVKTPAGHGAQCRMLYSNIKVVIVSGESSAEGRKRVKELLQTVFDELGKNAVLDSIDGGYVGAFGAAHAAKSQVETPKSMEDYINMPRRIPDEPMTS